MMLAGAICIAAAAVLYVLHPILTGAQASLHRENDEPTEAEARKRIALLALRDVEYDHATGKLDEEDYASLRDELTVEALDALQAIAANAADLRSVALATNPGDAAAASHASHAERPASGLPGGGSAGSQDDPLEREIATFRALLREQAEGRTPCTACSRTNASSSRFCAHCGAQLPAASAG